ncbi:MAG: hypothetical protein ACK48Y_04930, partial [Planctomyces sp.]
WRQRSRLIVTSLQSGRPGHGNRRSDHSALEKAGPAEAQTRHGLERKWHRQNLAKFPVTVTADGVFAAVTWL